MEEEQQVPVPRVNPHEEKRLERERKTQETAAKEKQLKAEYYKIAQTPAFLDLQAKIQSFLDYHIKVAKDAVGFENKTVGRDESNNPITEQVLIRFTSEQRLSDLDKGAGIQEIIDYVDRKLTIESSISSIKKKDKTDGN